MSDSVSRYFNEIHCLRVSIKRLRALWELVPPRNSSSEQTDRLEYLLKAQGRRLGQARDFHVITLRLLELHAPQALFPDTPAVVSPRDLSSARKLVADQTKALQRLDLSRSALRDSLRRSRRLEKKARFKCRRRKARAEDFHKWRKRSKNLMYQLKYAKSRGVEIAQGKLRRLTKRGHRLGVAHDYEILLGYLRKMDAAPKLIRKTKALREEMERESLRL